jgi:hypothetical protein
MHANAGTLRRALPRRFWLLMATAMAVSIPEFSGRMSAQEAKSPESEKLLIFRNKPSWHREPDFEEVTRSLKLPTEVKSSAEMMKTRLADYKVVVIPGAQWETGYYADFARAARAFDDYVQAGGILVLELNGAESEGITLPGGASMEQHAGTDNLLLLPRHPAVAPFSPRTRITANLASHGYLKNVPSSALVLATVMNQDGTADKAKPTYIEYAHGKGRIIAACQCFHDRDGSERGPLMPAVLKYASTAKWYPRE